MKKTALILIILLLILCLPFAVAAAGTANFSLKTSASQIRIGDTITITGGLNANESVATFDLNVTYPTGNLEYVKAEGLSVSSGELDINHSSGSIQFLYLDSDGGGSGITSANIFRITFKVIGGNVGDGVSAGISVKTAGNSNAEGMGTSGSGTSMTIAAPLSTNNNLASLNIGNGTLSPAFSAATTTYNVSVPFDVSKLSVTVVAADSGAQISINSPTLTPGGTTKVTVKVTAASGAEKVYTINAKRAQDPNYVANDNNNLASLSVEGFILSPGFDPAKTEYVVYLPYEVVELKVSAGAADGKASTSITGNTDLAAGAVNLIAVSCTAEDKSVKTYTIAAVRAGQFTGLDSLGVKPSPTPMPSATPTPEATAATTTQETTAPSTGNQQPGGDDKTASTDTMTTVFIILAALASTVAIVEGVMLLKRQ